MNVLEFFGRTAVYDAPIDVAPGIRATFFDAGHILGSASILLELEEKGTRRRLVMSGDIGNAGRPLLNPPKQPPQCDAVVMETTYGDRNHKPFGPSVEEFYAAIAETFARGGNVVIPTFALERAQELLYALHEAMAATGGCTSRSRCSSIRRWRSPPPRSSATIRRTCRMRSPASSRDGRDPLSLPGLHLTRETSDSMHINKISGGAIIMAGSGMATGGRVRHHLKHNLWRADAGVIFVGFAAQGTLARTIIDGADARAHLRRGHPGQGQGLHDQRLLGPCRPAGTARLAPSIAGGADVSGPRRRAGDDRLRADASGHRGGDAGDEPGIRSLGPNPQPGAPLARMTMTDEPTEEELNIVRARMAIGNIVSALDETWRLATKYPEAASVWALRHELLGKANHKDAFDHIYRSNVWKSGSGAGSSEENTGPYRAFVSDFIRSHQVQSVVDAGCGDWQSTQFMDWTGIDYLGVDVSAVVLENTRRFAAANIRFAEMDVRRGLPRPTS